jgi:hypothetical protein
MSVAKLRGDAFLDALVRNRIITPDERTEVTRVTFEITPENCMIIIQKFGTENTIRFIEDAGGVVNG